MLHLKGGLQEMKLLDKIRKPLGRLVEPSFKARGVKIYFWLNRELAENEQIFLSTYFVKFLYCFFENTNVYFYANYPKKGITEVKIIGLKPRFKVKESNAKSKYLQIEKQTVGAMVGKLLGATGSEALTAALFANLLDSDDGKSLFLRSGIINYNFQIAFGIIPPEDQNVESLLSEYSNLKPKAVQAALTHSLEHSGEVLWSCGGIPAHERPKIKLPQPIKSDLVPLNMIIPLE